MKCGHPQVERGEGAREVAPEPLGIALDEKQFPALPTKAWGKERVLGAHKNTLFLDERKTLMEEVQGRTEH